MLILPSVFKHFKKNLAKRSRHSKKEGVLDLVGTGTENAMPDASDVESGIEC